MKGGIKCFGGLLTTNKSIKPQMVLGGIKKIHSLGIKTTLKLYKRNYIKKSAGPDEFKRIRLGNK